jgi:hypothetical protein
MLVVSAVLFGGDVFFNDGNETRSLMFDSRVAVSSGARVQAYHITTFVQRKVELLLPGN